MVWNLNGHYYYLLSASVIAVTSSLVGTFHMGRSVATKNDLKELKGDMKEDVRDMKTDILKRIDENMGHMNLFVTGNINYYLTSKKSQVNTPYS